jgi:hypothetical protein
VVKIARGINDPNGGEEVTSKRRKSKTAQAASSGRNDTLVSADMLDHAVETIMKKTHLDRTWDIPYLAGYSRNGRNIYIDRHLPKSFVTKGRRVNIDQFLILHEAVEKALLNRLGLVYQHAHQIALRAEEAAVRAAGVSWREYDRFMQKYIKEVEDERLTRIPLDLDIKPYRDEHDFAVLKAMLSAIRKEETRRRGGRKRK